MTGYIKAFKPELKIKDYELYRGVYCSECRALGRLYTPIARMLLSYDFTFLSIVRLALQEQCGKFEKGRCCVNPAKKCLKCTDDAELERSADVVIIVSYYKLLDDIADGGFFKRLACRLIKPALSLMHKKAARRQKREFEGYLERDRAAAAAMEEQQKIEKSGTASLDEAADPSGKMLAAIFSQGYYGEDKIQLWRFGYLLGRWIYLLDAVDDIEKDIKSGSYNPLKAKFPDANSLSGDEFRKFAKERLDLTAGETANALNGLKFNRFGDIIENVVCDGMFASQTEIFRKKEGVKNEKESVLGSRSTGHGE